MVSAEGRQARKVITYFEFIGTRQTPGQRIAKHGTGQRLSGFTCYFQLVLPECSESQTYGRKRLLPGDNRRPGSRPAFWPYLAIALP